MPIEFTDDLWLATVDRMTVNADETVVFAFKNGHKDNRADDVKGSELGMIPRLRAFFLDILICTHRHISLTIQGSLQRKTAIFQ